MRFLMRNIVGRFGVALVVISLFAAANVGVASAHLQTVDPPGQDEPVHDDVARSRPWARAHCESNAPATTFDANGGVAYVTPQEPLPCDPHENPGGQVNPHSE